MAYKVFYMDYVDDIRVTDFGKRPGWNEWEVGLLLASVVLGVPIIIMWIIGLFEIASDESDSKALAAAVGLVGSVMASAVTLLGIVLKHSLDERNFWLAVETEKRIALENARNFNLALDAEKRNRTDTAIRAIDLLGENNRDASAGQVGGALLALVSLNELELATALLSDVWPKELCSPAVAETILRRALSSGSDTLTISASSVLQSNAERIQQDGWHIWPLGTGVEGWDQNLHPNCKVGLLRAACRWTAQGVSQHPNRISSGFRVFYQAAKDPKEGAAAKEVLRLLVEYYPESYSFDFRDEVLTMKELAARLPETPLDTAWVSELRRPIDSALKSAGLNSSASRRIPSQGE